MALSPHIPVNTSAPTFLVHRTPRRPYAAPERNTGTVQEGS